MTGAGGTASIGTEVPRFGSGAEGLSVVVDGGGVMKASGVSSPTETAGVGAGIGAGIVGSGIGGSVGMAGAAGGTTGAGAGVVAVLGVPRAASTMACGSLIGVVGVDGGVF